MKLLRCSAGKTLFCLGLFLTIFALPAKATTFYYWDPNNTASIGGNGTWDTTTKEWATSTSANGPQVASTALVAYPSTGALVVFCAGPSSSSSQGTFTITVNSAITCSGIYNGVEDPGSCYYTVSGTGSLAISGTQGFDNGGTVPGTATIQVPITGTGAVWPEGAGSLFLYASNSYSGGTVLDGTGVTYFNQNYSFGTGAISNAVSGDALVNNSATNVTLANAVNGSASSVNFATSTGATIFTGTWTFGTAAVYMPIGVGAGQPLILSGPLTGAGGFLKWNTNTLVLTAANTYTGATIVSNGVLMISNAGVLGGGVYSGLITNLSQFVYNSSANQTLANTISGAGSLIHEGSGALVLSGANTYTGATIITNGAKLVGSTGSSCAFSSVTDAGSTLSVSNTSSGSQWTVTNLTFTGTATLDFNYGSALPSSTTAPLKLTGAANFTTTPTVTIEGDFPGSGSFPLMTWNTTSGTAPTSAVIAGPRNLTGTLTVSGNTLYLTIPSNPEPLHWGAGNGAWDINTSQNWFDNNGNAAYYLQTSAPGDSVVFDDTYASGSPTITLNTSVQPAGVVFSNSVNDYTLTGTGAIAGQYVGLVKFGSGSLTIGTANSFIGPVAIYGGVVNITADNNLGSDTASPAAIAISNATLSSSGTFSLSGGRGMTLTGVATINVASGTLTAGNTNTGVFPIVKTGPGTLIFSGNHNTFSNIAIEAGIVQTGGDTQTANGAANLGRYPNNFSSTNVTLAGGMLQGNNPSFFFGQNRGFYLAAPSIIGSLTNDLMGFYGPFSGPNSLIISNASTGIVYTRATNTYTGATLISNGIFSVQGLASISNSSQIVINAAAALDVSLLTNTTFEWDIASGQSLVASGAGTGTNTSNGTANAAVINARTNGFASLGSSPVTLNFTPTLFSGDTAHPSLYVPQGTLKLTNNPITINNLGTSPLGPGVYCLIQVSNGVNGSLLGSLVTNSPANVAGMGIASGYAGALSIANGNVYLDIENSAGFSALTPNSSVVAGASSITLAGTVGNPTAGYPAQGENVTVTIDGKAQSTAISDGAGDFSITYNPSTIPAAAAPYTITYSYGGDATLAPAVDTSTALTVQYTPAFSALTASQIVTNGTASIALSGKLSAGSAYPPSGESVSVTINGNQQFTTLSDNAGDFSLAYNSSSVAANRLPYTITYAYGGDTYFAAGQNTNTTLTVEPAVAYWEAGVDTNWSTADANGSFNWAANQFGTNSAFAPPAPLTAVFFSANGATNFDTVLDTSFTIKSLAFTGASNVIIAGTNSLAIDSPAGITAASAAGSVMISNASVVLGVGQSWANNSANVLTVNAPVTGAASLTNAGSGTIVLGGANTYSGDTVLSSGTLALSGSGSISNSPLLSISAGATFDVSAIAAFAVNTNSALAASGASSPAVINGASAGTVNLGSQPITLTTDGVHPALTIAQGALVLNSNVFTVNAASPLAVGTYPLIQQTSGDISDSTSHLVSGSAVPTWGVGSISVSGGTVSLVIISPSAFSQLPATPSVTYGATSVALSGQLSGNGSIYPAQGETVSVSINGVPQTTTTSDASGDFSITYSLTDIPAGAYTVAYGYAGDSTLQGSTNAATSLTVNPAPLTVMATAQSKMYGQTIAVGPGNLNFTSVGLENGDAIDSVTLTAGGGDVATAPVSGSPYTLTPSAATGADFNPANYTITYETNSLTVTPAPLNITADNQSMSYGGAIPTLTVSYTGFVNNETPASLTTAPVVSTSATSGSGVGSYSITASGAVDSNYAITYTPGTLTIGAATLTYTANAATQAYGAPTPTLTGTVTGFVNGDSQSSATTGTLTWSTPATGTSPIGVYPITGSGLSSANYSFVQAGGNATALTVTPATVSVASGLTANDKSYDTTTNAALSITNTIVLAGLVGADQGSVTLSTNGYTAFFASPYVQTNIAVTVSGLTLTNGDYTNYSLVQPVLSADITPASITVLSGLSVEPVTYGALNPGNAAELSSNNVVLAGVFTADLANVQLDTNGYAAYFTSTNAGLTVPVTVSGLTLNGSAATNYTLVQPALTGVINPAPLTVTADSFSRVYGATNPVFTVEYSGFVSGDTAVSLSGSPMINCAATPSSPVGQYVITPSTGTLADSNYTFTFVNGLLTVTAQSPGSGTIANNNDGTITFVFQGSPGGTYVIQSSGDLSSPASWSNVTTNIADLSGNVSTTTAATNTAQFYRAVQQ